MDRVTLAILAEKLKKDWNQELEKVLRDNEFERGRYFGHIEIIEAIFALAERSEDVE